MNALDILRYGQHTVLGGLEGFPEEHWNTPGVCGVWSAKDVIAHLASYEWLLVDILTDVLGGGPTVYLDAFRDGGRPFNDLQVETRKGKSPAEVVAELQSAHAQVMVAMTRLPPDTLRQTGTLPWYGPEYALDDYIVYASYGHKREHSAQIAVFRDRRGG